MSERIVPSVDGQDDFYHDQMAPYRWALQLQADVVDQCSQIPYVVDQANRDDLAWEIMNRLVDENAVSQDLGYAALHHWRSIYRGHHG